uniref:Uncharacterized protein n=1 Tax=Ditylum brightwellii TaxID=49249 RepID=A0A7S1VXZ0_9STRA|mmetsp:Transcript_11263/g.16777  ORF Transcript_11263/g.16777 Transcript_11263/m.16777 type:complete len:746 (+) Transcript_11263:47-2284(+)
MGQSEKTRMMKKKKYRKFWSKTNKSIRNMLCLARKKKSRLLVEDDNVAENGLITDVPGPEPRESYDSSRIMEFVSSIRFRRRSRLSNISNVTFSGTSDNGAEAFLRRNDMPKLDVLRKPDQYNELERRTQQILGINNAAMGYTSVVSEEKSYQPLVTREIWISWVRSLRQLDPRLQIYHFFNDIARVGAKDIKKSIIDTNLVPKEVRCFQQSSVFSVWRPTSNDAIQKMVRGDARGKGLDIKGKSAKHGLISGYVPFLQIHSNDEHKKMVGSRIKGARVRVFYPRKKDRDTAASILEFTAEQMKMTLDFAKKKLSSGETLTSEQIERFTRQITSLEVDSPSINLIDDFESQKRFGLDVEERLFWESYVERQDITREQYSKNDTGRPSEPAYQDMNFGALRRIPGEGEPRAVLYQFGNVMDPLTLLMAYEEQGSVLPVVSDFDCFLVGTRNVSFEKSIPPDQIELLNWCTNLIEKTLDCYNGVDSWTKCWLKNLKEESLRGFHPHIPRFGFGDPKSYTMMESVIGRIQKNGAVRHGAECFNYYFPQDLDEEFLVVSDDTFNGKLLWNYVNEEELKSILSRKIDQGYTFPLNPKWVLCDKGWKSIYDKLMKTAQENPNTNVSQAVDSWYPPESGIRERIEEIHAKYPHGFKQKVGLKKSQSFSVTEDMDLAELELNRFITLRRAKRKLKAALLMQKLEKINEDTSSQKIKDNLSHDIEENPSDIVDNPSQDMKDNLLQQEKAQGNQE